MDSKKTGFGQLILLTGAIIGFLVGSGVATGQEILQYYTPYGLWAIGTAIVIAAILMVANYGFASAGHRGNFSKGSEVFSYYCGPKFGKVFDWFSVVFCYLSFIVMVGGGSSTLHQQFNAPPVVGALLVIVMAGVTVAFGLQSVVNIVSKIGIIKVVLVLTVSFIALSMTAGQLPENIARVQANEVEMVKAADSWFWAGVSNGGFCILWLAGYVATLSTKVDYRTLLRANVLSSVVLVILNMTIGFALLANIDQVKDLQVPNLYLAGKIWTPLPVFYSLITFIALCTTACPLLWTASSRFSTEGTAGFKVLTVVLAVLGLIVAMFLPYNKLMNYIYVVNGYLGAALLSIMVFRMVMMKLQARNNPVTEMPEKEMRTESSAA